MKFDCPEPKRYNCLGVKGFLICLSMIMSVLWFVFTWIYFFLSIFAFPFVIIGWLKEKYLEN